MRKTDKKREKAQGAAGQLRFAFRALARQALWDTVVLSGFGFVQDELGAERTALCGECYAHQEQRQVVELSLAEIGRRLGTSIEARLRVRARLNQCARI